MTNAGAGPIRLNVGCGNCRFRFMADAGLSFTVPNVTASEGRFFKHWYYDASTMLDVEVGGAFGVDLGEVSGSPRSVTWWKNVTIEGRLGDVNAAIDGKRAASEASEPCGRKCDRKV